MPSRTRTNFIGTTTIAFCTSLALHTLLVVGAITLYAHERIFLSGFDRSAIVEAKAERIVIPLPELDRPDEPDPQMRFGKSDGTGSAIDESAGEQPMLARKGPQDQPLLRKDPGDGSPAEASEPSPAVEETVQALPPPETSPETSAKTSTPEQAVPFGVGSLEREDEVPVPPVNASAPAPPPAPPAAQPPAQASAPRLAANTSGAGGEAAEKSDTESDPFTVIGAVKFQPGGIKAQLGRAHRLTHPRAGLYAMVDAGQLGRARLVLQITIDQDGNVKEARVAKSSGSDSVDQSYRIAAYEWWIEARNGPDGQPLKEETFCILVGFY